MHPNEFPLKTWMSVEVDIPESPCISTITTFNLPFENVIHVNLDTLLQCFPTDSKLNRYLEALPKVLILKDNKPIVAFITIEDTHKILVARLVLNFINNTQSIFDALGQDHVDLLKQIGIINDKENTNEKSNRI